MTTTATFTVQYDATSDHYRFDVIDADGDVCDSFATRAEALAEAAERTTEAEVEELQAAIEAELLDVTDLATLRKIAAILKL